uniref:Myelin expression factor 2 n=1 Tax=Neogobius melanostomus TaxID=47308 RepID=A0A8C6WND6_9GOBI
MADVTLIDEDQNKEESTVGSEHEETSQETHNDDEKQDGTDRSENRRGNRFHPYNNKQDRKAGQRNRVFISNIPYDMKWQAIKDLMREKGNLYSGSICKILFGSLTGMGGGFGGLNNMGGFGRDMGRMGDMYRSGMGGMDFRSDMSMSRGFGDSFGGMGGGMGSMSMDRMGSGFDRMGMSGGRDNRGFGGFGGSGSGHMSGGMSNNRSSGAKRDVMYAEIKMENGKSKGCGTVRFDTPETAENACRLMNGTKINGRDVDVRIDRNA